MAATTLPELVTEFIKDFSAKFGLKNVEIKSKTEPDWMLKIVGAIVKIFNKNFDAGYVTSINNTIWVPRTFGLRTAKNMLEIIAHELIHIRDKNKWTPVLYAIAYLTPQILALLALLSIFFSNWWLLCLLFLLPLPSIKRTYLELQAYRLNILFTKYVEKADEEQMKRNVEWYANQFTESYYYFMWPFKAHIISLLSNTEKYEKKEPYAWILNWLKEKKVF